MFIPTDTNMGGNGGLSSLMSQPHQPPSNPLERPGASAVLDILSRYPGLNPAFTQSILGMLSGNIQARQQQKQDTRQQGLSDYFQLGSEYAGSGYATPEGLTALQSSYQAANPALQGPNISGRLSDLTSNLGEFAATVPGPEGTMGGELDGEDLAMMEQVITAGVEGAKAGTPGSDLHSVRMALMNKFRLLGYSSEAQQKASVYIEQMWAREATRLELDKPPAFEFGPGGISFGWGTPPAEN